MNDEAQQQIGQQNINQEIIETIIGSQLDNGRMEQAEGATDSLNGPPGRINKASSLIYQNDEVYMIPRQMSQQTHQIQQSWNRNNRKPVGSKKRGNIVYKKQPGFANDMMDPQAVTLTKFGKQKTIENRLRTESTTIDRKINISKSSNQFNDSDMLKQVGKDGTGLSSKTYIGQERSVHRQLKTFYGQVNGAASGQQALIIHPHNQPLKKELNNNSELFDDKFAEINGPTNTGGSSSVGATKTKLSANGPNTATSGWSTSLANDQQSKEVSRTSTKFNKADGANDYKLYSNRMKTKENQQQVIYSGLQELINREEGNYYKTSLLRTGKQNGKDTQSTEVGILKSYLKDPAREQTPETEEAIQRVLQQIMFQTASMPPKGNIPTQNRQRALTVGEAGSSSSAYLFKNSRKGDMYHIPRYQREIIMRELLQTKSKHQVPQIQNEAAAYINGQNATKLAQRPPKTSKKQKNAKNVIVRRIKSGGGNMVQGTSSSMAAAHGFSKKEEGEVKNASKTVDPTQRGYDDEKSQEPGKRSTDGVAGLLPEGQSPGHHHEGTEHLDTDDHQKGFDLSQARAMFMPHKVPQRNGLESADSQEELRKLTGNEIWELTQKAAVHDYQKTVQMRQQYPNEMAAEDDQDVGFGLALAEALGFQDEQQPVRTQSHLRRGLFLSDDGDESVMADEQEVVSQDPANIASSHNQSPRESREANRKDVVKKEARYSHAGVDQEKKMTGQGHQKGQYKSQNFKNLHDARGRAPKSQGATDKIKSQKYESGQTPLSSKGGEERNGIVLPKVKNQSKANGLNSRAERFEAKSGKDGDRPGKSLTSSQPQSGVLDSAQKRRSQALDSRHDRVSQDPSRKHLKLITQSSGAAANMDRLIAQKEDKPYKDDDKRAANNRSDKAGSRLNSILMQPSDTSRLSQQNQMKKEASQDRSAIGVMGRGLQSAAPAPATIVPQRMIPRTGIEQPFLIDPPIHMRNTNDYERTNEISTMLKLAIVEDYKLKDANRIINLAKTVFDIDRDSPHYKNQQEYLNIQDQIRIIKPQVNGRPIENPRMQTKNRYFKTLNPWYKPYSCSAASKDNKNNSSATKQTSQEGQSRPEQIVDDVLLFESRFESGNLKKAIQVEKNEYELILKPDYGTKNFTQWFYFKISNTRRYREYTFHIINFVKGDSQFNDGMMPLFYSEKEAEQQNVGWYRSGYDIAYYQNNQPLCKIYGEQNGENGKGGKFTSNAAQIIGVNQKEPTNFYTLSFKFSLKHDNDDVYIAMCYPYTYTDCHNFLDYICKLPQSQTILRRASLCKTLAFNNLEMLIITNFQSSQDHIAKRKCIILTGRVHPGESNSSFVMEGVIRYLVSNETMAVQLRDRYVFKIVPMLNPDGVIIGNYRCSLSGHDLNRQYLNPSPKFFPECNAIKQMIKKTLECRKIDLYCDFHGHSRQKDIFMYGCNNNSAMPMIQERRYREQVFPMMYDRLCPYFSFQGCSFAIQKAKESTGRVVMFRENQIVNSFTCEASFCGTSQGMYKGLHFNIQMLLDMGKDFCRTLAVYSEPDSSYYDQILTEIQYVNESQQHHQEGAASGGAHQASAQSKALKEGKVHFLIQNGLAGDKTSASKSLQAKQKSKKPMGLIK